MITPREDGDSDVVGPFICYLPWLVDIGVRIAALLWANEF